MQRFGTSVQKEINSHLEWFYRVPGPFNTSNTLEMTYFDQIIRRIAEDINVSEILLDILNRPVEDTIHVHGRGREEYYASRTRMQRKIDLLSNRLSRDYQSKPLIYPLEYVDQMQELQSAIRHFVDDAEREGFTKTERLAYLEEISPRPIHLHVYQGDNLVVIREGPQRRCTFAHWLFEEAKKKTPLDNLLHFAACRIYYMFVNYKVVDELSKMLKRTDGSSLCVQNRQFMVYSTLPSSGVITSGMAEVDYVIPFRDQKHREFDCPHRIHLLTWLENRLHGYVSLREFESVIGPLLL